MDVRAPTHEITLAHAVFRARRRILDADPSWALSIAGLDALRGRASGGKTGEQGRERTKAGHDDDLDPPESLTDESDGLDLADEFAALDAAVARSRQFLSSMTSARDPFVYDPDWDEDGKQREWREAVRQTDDLPPILAAAIALEAWEAISPLQHSSWLGRQLAAALVRRRQKARAHLPCLNTGMRMLPRERRRAKDREAQLVVFVDSFAAAALKGMEDHDRWLLARRQLERKLAGRRSTSKLPALIDLVMGRPVVSSGMIAKALSVTPRAAQDLVVELGLRETTGKGRYRAWGVL